GLMLGLAAGCNTQKDREKPSAKKEVAAEDDHDHGPGPHKGTVTDWGDGKYHVEFTVNHKKQEATVYVLKGDAKTDAPIKADRLLLKISKPPFEVELKAVPQETDPKGKSSRFAG